MNSIIYDYIKLYRNGFQICRETWFCMFPSKGKDVFEINKKLSVYRSPTNMSVAKIPDFPMKDSPCAFVVSSDNALFMSVGMHVQQKRHSWV